MSTLSASLARTATAVEDRQVSPRSTRAELMLCMVVSSDEFRIQFFDRVAEEQGWETVLVVDTDEAMKIATRERLRLAIVDLQAANPSIDAAYRRFIDWMAKKRQPLLIVCGNEDDPTAEIWSRQLGVWLYLAGVDEQTDFAMVCNEARKVSEKIYGPTPATPRPA